MGAEIFGLPNTVTKIESTTYRLSKQGRGMYPRSSQDGSTQVSAADLR